MRLRSIERLRGEPRAMLSARALEGRAPLRMLAESTPYCACAGPALSGNVFSILRRKR